MITTTKQEVRRKVKEVFKTLPYPVISEESKEIMKKVEALPEFQAAESVAVYWPLPDEVQTHEFIAKWCGVKTILLPVVCGDNLNMRRYTKGCAMESGEYNVSIPCAEPYTGKIDMIIVPGTAFDREGNRMGRGKGFYDRFLKTTDIYKAGVCFGFQLFDSIPAEEHDVGMDIVISV